MRRRIWFALAMPRGAGKTSLALWMAAIAVVTGHHRYVVLIAATRAAAKKLMVKFKKILKTAHELAADFPEALYPLRKLHGEARLAAGQLHHGEETDVEWGTERIVFASIPGAPASGAVVECVSLLGAARGLSHITAEGETIRPTLVIADDPQTDASAKSKAQSTKRLGILTGAIAGLVGAGFSITVVVACTVIEAGDLSEQILDTERFPEYRGERTKMIYTWPHDTAKWEKYLALRAQSIRERGDISAATEFYAANRAAMDEGADVAWPARFDPATELSALQNVYNTRANVKHKFQPEYQNEPPVTGGQKLTVVTEKGLAARIIEVPRGVVPQDCERLTAFIDVQLRMLWWLVAAWRPGLGGHVVAYGAFPDQRRGYFQKSDIEETFETMAPGRIYPVQLRKALDLCTDQLVGHQWPRADGATLRVERVLIDSGYGKSTGPIFKFCEESKFGALLMPSKGGFLGPKDIPFNERRPKDGVHYGHHWQMDVPRGRAVRQVFYDTNRFKTLTHDGLQAAIGEPSAITIHAGDEHTHEMLFHHLTAERPELESKGGRTTELWTANRNQDNDLFDCLVGAAVAASTLGVSPEDGAATATTPRPPSKKAARRRSKAKF